MANEGLTRLTWIIALGFVTLNWNLIGLFGAFPMPWYEWLGRLLFVLVPVLAILVLPYTREDAPGQNTPPQSQEVDP